MFTGGLALPWCLPQRQKPRYTCYENFPYSQPGAWTAKLLAELASGNVREHIRLCMFATSSEWWLDMCVKPRRNPRILGLKRVFFLDPRIESLGKKPAGCRFEPALVYFGPRAQRFDRVFAARTRWSTWGRP
jgi:hypothetical protein